MIDLKVNIHNIKNIKDLTIDLPLTKGVYILTGENGVGKSTILSSVASVFYNFFKDGYFGETSDGAYIDFWYEKKNFKVYKEDGKWKRDNNRKFLKNLRKYGLDIKGFYEGSLIWGNRSRNISYYDEIPSAEVLEKIKSKKKSIGENLRKQIGYILHGDEAYYKNIWRSILVERDTWNKYVYFYELPTGEIVDSFHLSTAETLLVSAFDILYEKISKQLEDRPHLILLDEIEIGLHPSAAVRLYKECEKISNKHNAAIYVSTHSIEIINLVSPYNCFYLQTNKETGKHEILNPCFPAYVSSVLHGASGFDRIIAVEDGLAKRLIEIVLAKEARLKTNKRIYIVPLGGSSEVIKKADSWISDHFLPPYSQLNIILDGDMKSSIGDYLMNNPMTNHISIGFLPINSLEKYLKEFIVDHPDAELINLLNTEIFTSSDKMEDLRAHYLSHPPTDKDGNPTSDANGKAFFKQYIKPNLKRNGKTEEELIDLVVNYLYEQEDEKLTELITFLEYQMS